MTALTDCVLGFAYILGPLMRVLFRKDPVIVDPNSERSKHERI